MQEDYDILDDNGQLTGRSMNGVLVHEKGLRHGSVHVWIIDQNQQILLQFRAANKKIFPSCWDTSVAGHLSSGDTAFTAATREISEEIGIKISVDDLVLLGEFPEEFKMITGQVHREYNWVLGTRQNFYLSNLKIQKSELTDLKLVSSSELHEILNDESRRKELSGHADMLFELAIKFAEGE